MMGVASGVVVVVFLLAMFQLPSARGNRAGTATSTWSCSEVREVPAAVRTDLALDPFYTRYTEAYGIPVLSSGVVPDAALSRACYTLRFLMADRADVRQWYYWKMGRVAVMGEDQVTLDIPEHSGMSEYWNTRARGLGATPGNPVTSGAEENLLCYDADRYHPEDIMLHELAHGVHLVGLWFAEPDWITDLNVAFQAARAKGLWNGT